jgi:hypothetical protein
MGVASGRSSSINGRARQAPEAQKPCMSRSTEPTLARPDSGGRWDSPTLLLMDCRKAAPFGRAEYNDLSGNRHLPIQSRILFGPVSYMSGPPASGEALSPHYSRCCSLAIEAELLKEDRIPSLSVCEKLVVGNDLSIGIRIPRISEQTLTIWRRFELSAQPPP